MKKNQNNFFAIIALLIIGGLFLSACQTVPSAKPPSTPNDDKEYFYQTQEFDPAVDIKTNSFSTEEEYLAFLKATQDSGTYSSYYGGVMMEKSLSISADSISATPSADPGRGMDMSEAAEGNSYSGTNNQVATVDEADIIKTDGNYIYTVSGNTLFIIKAYPGEDAEVVSEIKFKTPPQGIFIDGNNLAVFGYVSDYDFLSSLSIRKRNQFTYFNVYDISNKENPELKRELKLEGSYFEARLVDGTAYFVTVTSPDYRKKYATPIMFDGTSVKSMPVTNIYYFPIPYDSVQLASIHAISMSDYDDEIESKSVAVEYGQTMYMNEENLYITYTEYINEWQIKQDMMIEMVMPRLNDADLELIEKIEDADSDVLSNAEKQSKIIQIVYDYLSYLDSTDRLEFEKDINKAAEEKLKQYEYMEYTIINKISYEGDELEVEANGKVPGHLLNQFSMDEHDGVLRIATTLNARWSATWKEEEERTQSSNNIFTLDEDLDIIDSEKNIAKGERIYSTRFMGDKLYMVTFRQVDPFFVYDLSDPENIVALGELKIPGFSRYLHPYDENTIIGIGRDATTEGRQLGLKISLFDVSDFERPKEIAKFVTDNKYANSVAEYEHKAFLFDKEKQLLVIPAYSYNDDDWDMPMPIDIDDVVGISIAPRRASGFNGALVFNITKNDIELRGLIDHSSKTQYWRPSVERSLYINELLYTKSEGLLRINKLSDLTKVKNIELDGYASEYPVY